MGLLYDFLFDKKDAIRKQVKGYSAGPHCLLLVVADCSGSIVVVVETAETTGTAAGLCLLLGSRVSTVADWAGAR